MSVEQLEQQIERLPREELGRLVSWLDRFLGRTTSEDSTQPPDLSDEEKAELLRRREELLANPHWARPMDNDYFSGLKHELTRSLARKTSSS